MIWKQCQSIKEVNTHRIKILWDTLLHFMNQFKVRCLKGSRGVSRIRASGQILTVDVSAVGIAG